MQTSRWNRIVIAGLVGAACFVVAFNYLLDPYDIFQSRLLPPGPLMNERFNKVEHILETKGRYTSFIVGSSAMGAYEPAWLEARRPGSRFYNASFFGGIPRDAHRLLMLMKERGVRVDEIFMGIDLFPFLQADDAKSPSQQHHYLVAGERPWSFYGNYLFASSVWHAWIKFNNSQLKTPFIRFDVERTGRYYLEKQDHEIAVDQDAYIKKKFGSSATPRSPANSVAWIDKRFEELRSFVELTRSTGIRTTFFIQPCHHLLRESLPASDLASFRDRIFAITGLIPDFSSTREITDDDRLYYDPKHYLPSVAKGIVEETVTLPAHAANFSAGVESPNALQAL